MIFVLLNTFLDRGSGNHRHCCSRIVQSRESLGNFVPPKRKKNSSTGKNDTFEITVLMIIRIVFMPIISLGNFVAPTKKKNSRTEEKT